MRDADYWVKCGEELLALALTQFFEVSLGASMVQDHRVPWPVRRFLGNGMTAIQGLPDRWHYVMIDTNYGEIPYLVSLGKILDGRRFYGLEVALFHFLLPS